MSRMVKAVAYSLTWGSAACYLVMMFLTAGDVVGRYLLSLPIRGAQEITELLMVIVVFLAIPYTQVIKGHVRVGVLISRLSKRSQATLDSITSILSAAAFALVAWQLGKRAWVSLLNPGLYRTPTTEVPIGSFVLVAAIGCLMLCLVLLVDFFKLFGWASKDVVG